MRNPFLRNHPCSYPNGNLRRKTFVLLVSVVWGRLNKPWEVAPVAWVSKQSRTRLLSQDVQALEKIWFTLDQLAGDHFKAILQGTGYLRGPNCGLSQKVVVWVLKKTDGRVKASWVERLRVQFLVLVSFFDAKSWLKLLTILSYSFIKSYIHLCIC